MNCYLFKKEREFTKFINKSPTWKKNQQLYINRIWIYLFYCILWSHLVLGSLFFLKQVSWNNFLLFFSLKFYFSIFSISIKIYFIYFFRKCVNPCNYNKLLFFLWNIIELFCLNELVLVFFFIFPFSFFNKRKKKLSFLIIIYPFVIIFKELIDWSNVKFRYPKQNSN